MKKFFKFLLVVLVLVGTYYIGYIGGLKTYCISVFELFTDENAFEPLEYSYNKTSFEFDYGTNQQDMKSAILEEIVTKNTVKIEQLPTEVGFHSVNITIYNAFNKASRYVELIINPNNDNVVFDILSHKVEDNKLYLLYDITNHTGDSISAFGEIYFSCVDNDGNMVASSSFGLVDFEPSLENGETASWKFIFPKGSFDSSYFESENIFISTSATYSVYYG